MFIVNENILFFVQIFCTFISSNVPIIFHILIHYYYVLIKKTTFPNLIKENSTISFNRNTFVVRKIQFFSSKRHRMKRIIFADCIHWVWVVQDMVQHDFYLLENIKWKSIKVNFIKSNSILSSMSCWCISFSNSSKNNQFHKHMYSMKPI